MVKPIKQFEVWLVSFDPSVGTEITKTRPAIVLSNNPVNKNLETVIAAPLTTTVRNYPSRYDTNFEDKGGQIALDQLTCLDKSRFKKKIGEIRKEERQDVLDILELIFKPA